MSKTSPEGNMLQAYLDTLLRMERDIVPTDADVFYASAAISLKRIADSLEKIAQHMGPLAVTLTPMKPF